MNGENKSVFTNPVSCSSPSADNTTAGQYGITCSGGAADNYSFNYVSGTLYVNSAAKSDQTITFGSLTDQNLGVADFGVSATATSGLTVSFSATTTSVCTVTSDGTVVHLGATGTCTIKASQGGDTNFNPAPDVSQSFTVYPAGVALPTGPADGAVLNNNSLTFTWSPVTGATSYQLQIGFDINFKKKLKTLMVTLPTYTYTNLPANKTFYWHVRAEIGKVWGSWSATRSFMTILQPSTPNSASAEKQVFGNELRSDADLESCCAAQW